jgi:hypothetical protein
MNSIISFAEIVIFTKYQSNWLQQNFCDDSLAKKLTK